MWLKKDYKTTKKLLKNKTKKKESRNYLLIDITGNGYDQASPSIHPSLFNQPYVYMCGVCERDTIIFISFYKINISLKLNSCKFDNIFCFILVADTRDICACLLKIHGVIPWLYESTSFELTSKISVFEIL